MLVANFSGDGDTIASGKVLGASTLQVVPIRIVRRRPRFIRREARVAARTSSAMRHMRRIGSSAALATTARGFVALFLGSTLVQRG